MRVRKRVLTFLLVTITLFFGLLSEGVQAETISASTRGSIRFKPGNLVLEFVPSFEFGIHEISDRDQFFSAEPHYEFDEETADYIERNYLSLSDRRGVNTGWTLQVRQEGQLSSDDAERYTELVGAQIVFVDAEMLTPDERENGRSEALEQIRPSVNEVLGLVPYGEVHNVAIASYGQGMDVWHKDFGSAEDIENGIRQSAVGLFIPGTSGIEAVRYNTTLTWILSAGLPND